MKRKVITSAAVFLLVLSSLIFVITDVSSGDKTIIDLGDEGDKTQKIYLEDEKDKIQSSDMVISDFESRGSLDNWTTWGGGELEYTDNSAEGNYALNFNYDLVDNVTAENPQSGVQYNLNENLTFNDNHEIKLYLKDRGNWYKKNKDRSLSWNLLSIQLFDNQNRAIKKDISLTNRMMVRNGFLHLRIPRIDFNQMNESNGFNNDKIQLMVFQMVKGGEGKFENPYNLENIGSGTLTFDGIAKSDFSPASPYSEKVVTGSFPAWTNYWSTISLKRNINRITHINPSLLRLNHTSQNGSIRETVRFERNAKFIKKEFKFWSRNARIPVIPLLNNFDITKNTTTANGTKTVGGWNYETIEIIVQNSTKRSNLVNNLYNYVIDKGYSGIDIDLEGQSSDVREGFKLFMKELYEKFNSNNLYVWIDVPVLAGEYHENWLLDMKFNESEGNIVEGEDNETGTIINYNEIVWREGVYDSAIQLDSTYNQFIEMNEENKTFNEGDNLTVSCFVNRSIGGQNEDNAIVKPSSYFLSAGRSWSDNSMFYIYINGNPHSITGKSIPAGEWVHITGKYNSTEKKMYIYHDGSLINEKNISSEGSYSDWSIDSSSQKLKIGDGYFGYFDGGIDGVNIIREDIPKEEIKALSDGNYIPPRGGWGGWKNPSIISQYTDLYSVMAYGYAGFWSNLSAYSESRYDMPISPMNWVSEMMDNTKRFVPNEKLVLSVGGYGYEYGGYQVADLGHAYGYDYQLIQKHDPKIWYDNEYKTGMFQYKDDETGLYHTIHLQGTESLWYKMKYCMDNDFLGVRLWYIGIEEGHYLIGLNDNAEWKRDINNQFWRYMDSLKDKDLGHLDKNNMNFTDFEELDLESVISTVSPISPEQGSIIYNKESVELKIQNKNTIGDTSEISFYNGNGELIGVKNNVSSRENVTIEWNGLNTGETYEWYVTVNSTYGNTTSEVWNFTNEYSWSIDFINTLGKIMPPILLIVLPVSIIVVVGKSLSSLGDRID